MIHPLGFDALKDILHHRIAQLPDHRKQGPNTQYAIHDAALGAFGIFFTQSASFLECQRQLQHTQGRNNVRTLLGVEQIPCDNQVRTRLDPLAPSHLDAVFLEVFAGLEQHRMLTHFRVLGDQLLVALDGTTYLSSKRFIALTVLPANSPMVRPSTIMLPSPQCSSALDSRRSLRYPQSTACRKTGRSNRTASARRVNAGCASMPPRLPPMA